MGDEKSHSLRNILECSAMTEQAEAGISANEKFLEPGPKFQNLVSRFWFFAEQQGAAEEERKPLSV
jgi:hypothetical protein